MLGYGCGNGLGCWMWEWPWMLDVGMTLRAFQGSLPHFAGASHFHLLEMAALHPVLASPPAAVLPWPRAQKPQFSHQQSGGSEWAGPLRGSGVRGLLRRSKGMVLMCSRTWSDCERCEFLFFFFLFNRDFNFSIKLICSALV